LSLLVAARRCLSSPHLNPRELHDVSDRSTRAVRIDVLHLLFSADEVRLIDRKLHAALTAHLEREIPLG